MTELEYDQRRMITMRLIWNEYARARNLYPDWPQNMVLGAATALEEAGEALKEVNNLVQHGKGSIEEIRKESVEAATMWIRFLVESNELWK